MPSREILYDDRDESPGVKFTDAELLGMPWILTVSPRSLAAGGVEVTERATGERAVRPIEDVDGVPGGPGGDAGLTGPAADGADRWRARSSRTTTSTPASRSRVDASPEAIELAWRALLKQHHPDVAGDDAAALERAKRINVAHDWLSDPSLRARYDRERARCRRRSRRVRGPDRRPARAARPAPGPPQPAPRPARAPGARRSTRPDLVRGDPAERLARFLDRVARLTPDELDRLAAAEPPPIAFLATVRRFLTPDATAAFAAAEAALAARVPPERWAEVGLREGLLGVAAELVLVARSSTTRSPSRSAGRARDRLLRAWEASIDQPRYGPNGAEVLARARSGGLDDPRPRSPRSSARPPGIAGDDRPWPPALDRDEDEALRISALLAARDVAAALPVDGLAPATVGDAAPGASPRASAT